MNKLKIRTNGMMASEKTQGNASSWAFTIHYLLKEFHKLGHELYINTTNGIQGVPKEFLRYFRDCSNPDIDFCYTLPQNAPARFSGSLAGTKRARIRCLVFNFESSVLPDQWASYHKYFDLILPSSKYCADIFERAGIPPEKIVVMPLGVDFEALDGPLDKDFQLQTKKKFKLLNVSIPHYRKNIPLLVDSYFEEFSNDDDICLIVKTSFNNNEKKNHFEIDVRAAINEVSQNHRGKKLPELMLMEHRFNNMATIYKQTDALINVSCSEGFGLPILEAAYCGNLVAAPRYSGPLDFLNHNENSLLIDTKEGYADERVQYWQASKYARVGYPLKESIMKTMRNLYENSDELHKKFDGNMTATVEKFTWANSAKIMLDLYNGIVPEKTVGELL